MISSQDLAIELAAMRRLHVVATRLIEDCSFETLLGEILEAALDVVGAEKGVIQLFDADCCALRLAVQRGFGPDFVREFQVVKSGVGICGTAMREGRRIVVQDATTHPLFDQYQAIVAAAGFKGVQSTPMVSREGELLGMLSTHFGDARCPNDGELRFLDLLARQAADFIERTRNIEAVKAAATRSAQLQQLTAVLANAVTPHDAARAIGREACSALGARAAFVWLLTADGRRLELVSYDGYQGLALDPYRSIAVEAPVAIADAVRRRDIVFLGNREDCERAYPAVLDAADEGSRAWVAVPLATEEEAFGGFVLSFAEERVFGGADETFLRTIAQQCTQTIVRARLFEAARVADRRKDEFLAMLGHELRNPLAPILTALQMMTLKGTTGGERERDIIERQTRHLVRLVDDLLDISRITRGKIELRRARTDIAIVLAKAVEMASPILEQRSHHLQIEAARNVHYVDGDESRLAQVFHNLLTNAAKYTPIGGQIALRLMTSGGAVVIEVEDDGDGIAAELLPSIFEPFVQGERGVDRSQGGLGLGLALVHSLVTLHNGSVAGYSEGPRRGSRFVVSFPVSVQAEPPAIVPAIGPLLSAARRRRVLLVDDNADAVETLADLLRSSDHEVLVTLDGPAALARAEAFGPEVALLDIGLPVMDGYELARKLQTLLPTPIRLVAITGYGQEHDRQRCLDAGFAEHLVKPVEWRQVLAAVEHEESSGARSAVLEHA
jgi:signal transduction histidine kinase/ActR/RegA family two-component response regulator